MKNTPVGIAATTAATALLLSACSADDQTDAQPSSSTATTSVAESEQVTEPVPDTVVVYRPGAIDNNFTADEVPAWPGPDPSDVLEPNPPSGERGTISGDDAAAVYQAALENPETLLQDGQAPRDVTGAVWWVNNHAEWLVVEPQW